MNMQMMLLGVLLVMSIAYLEAQPVYFVPVSEVLEYNTRPARSVAPGDSDIGASGRVSRQAGGHHDVVDFGAHTGDHGAFGWYADFPVSSHE